MGLGLCERSPWKINNGVVFTEISYVCRKGYSSWSVDLESRNKFRFDLLLQHAVRSLVLQTLIVRLCLGLVLVHPHYPSSSWKWIASCNNNLVWALKVIWFGHLKFYYPCIHDYTCCQEQLALDLLSTKTVELEEWYKAFTQQKSKLYFFLIKSLQPSDFNQLLSRRGQFLSCISVKIQFLPGRVAPLDPPTRALPLDPTRAYAAPGPGHFQRIF